MEPVTVALDLTEEDSYTLLDALQVAKQTLTDWRWDALERKAPPKSVPYYDSRIEKTGRLIGVLADHILKIKHAKLRRVRL